MSATVWISSSHENHDVELSHLPQQRRNSNSNKPGQDQGLGNKNPPKNSPDLSKSYDDGLDNVHVAVYIPLQIIKRDENTD